MKTLLRLAMLYVSVATIGCGSEPGSSEEKTASTGTTSAVVEADPAVAAMSELSEEDRKLAVSQKFCVVSESSLLGSMGKPIKLDVSGEAVFICCEGCRSKALEKPEETLAVVKRLREANGAN